MSSETMELADAADAAIMLQHELITIHGRTFSITLLNGTKSLFDLIAKGTSTTEKRLMVDLCSTREAYDTDLINYLGWIRREYIPAD